MKGIAKMPKILHEWIHKSPDEIRCEICTKKLTQSEQDESKKEIASGRTIQKLCSFCFTNNGNEAS